VITFSQPQGNLSKEDNFYFPPSFQAHNHAVELLWSMYTHTHLIQMIMNKRLKWIFSWPL